ncbi:LuxR C-terminal-related transcriptional regulator [Streptomyces sp. NBC_00335]|uniref:LuxR C-terminal-related transcriptional regulator n=1 Tax=unclassified Streptomyces TaxID=2593676 RepID=UPI0022550629|nr:MULTISPECIES: LuxR C-terminal-related transcriptional regulator [unclassified Streptomyces]MCX5407475.1 LuxR C-terminal-related transcriptional regulator [Streptomyces sp. NBC_00086]
MTAPARQLARRELQALHLVAAGTTHAEAARQLVMTPKGFTATVNRAMRKLGARNAPHAVLLACRAGILDGRLLEHGDHNGYETHIRRRIPLCDDCRDGEKAYRDGLKAARQAQEAA